MSLDTISQQFLRKLPVTVLRFIPVGLRIDLDLRTRFPDLLAAPEQALLRQLDTHAALLRPEVHRHVPAGPQKPPSAANVHSMKRSRLRFERISHRRSAKSVGRVATSEAKAAPVVG